jgi:YegS/Rv2252/BmrU family lipid kinase
MKKYYLLVNPKGGHKRGLEIYEKVKHIFSSAGTNITVLHTEYAGHAFDFANTLDFVGYDGLCAIGGDGTMYELINGMLKRDDNHKIPIGLITGGTGNSFMYDVDCLDPIDAAKRIVQHNLRPLDIAKVNANGELFYSFNIIGWGLATDAGKLAEKLRWLGGVRYDVASIIEVLKGKDRIATLTLDEEVIKENFIFIIGCNTIHTGKAMKMAPLAQLNDGKIDLIIVRKTSRINLLKLFPKLFSGDHIKSPLVEYRQVQNFSISLEETNDLTIDGEIIGTTPLNVQIVPKMVNVLV